MGAWEERLLFFLEGVEKTAEEAVQTATRILEIFARDRACIEILGRPVGNALRVHSLLQRKPLVSVPPATNELNLSAPTVRSEIENLQKIGLMSEMTGKQRDRLFVYSRLPGHFATRYRRKLLKRVNHGHFINDVVSAFEKVIAGKDELINRASNAN